MIIAIPLPVRMALALLLCAAFAHAAYRHVWRKGKGAICEVAFLSDKDETIQIKLGGKIKRGKIKHSFFCVWLCVVVVSCQKKKYAVMATPYCLPADQHRQLRVLLNYVIGQNATEKSSTMTRLGQTLRRRMIRLISVSSKIAEKLLSYRLIKSVINGKICNKVRLFGYSRHYRRALIFTISV